MEGDWITIPIRSIAEGIYDGPHATPKRIEDGPFFLGISSLADGRIDLSKSDRISDIDFKKWTRRVVPQPGDLVFSYETRLGQAAIIPEGLRCCLGRRMALLRPDQSRIDPRYLLYVFLGSAFQDTIRARTIHGSTVDRILLTEFPNFPITLHKDIAEQRRIAAVLGALDDRIEANRRMNRTLEQMAHALFRSRFVDFDGRDDLVESEAGPIPAGWSQHSFYEVVDVLGGGTPKRDVAEYWGGSIPWVSAKDASQNTGVFIIDTEERTTEAGIANSSACIRPAWTTVITARGTVGETVLLPEPMAYNQSCYGLRPKNEAWFRTLFLMTRNMVDLLKQQAHGAIFDTITHRTFQSIQVLWPSDVEGNQFESQITPLFDRMLINARHNRTLTTLRDALLPKLISGEIRVPEEAIVSGLPMEMAL